MSVDTEGPDTPPNDPQEDGRRWDTTSFMTGILLGAAVGAGVALIFAPATGARTRRLIRGRARAVRRDAAESWVSAKEDAREALRDRKEALKQRLAKGVERLGEELGV
jgi:gas vesicle protein